MSDKEKRLAELMQPIEQQILMCDDRDDMLLLACGMMQSVRCIFDNELGESGRKTMFKGLT
jgi:hypothetical protein